MFLWIFVCVGCVCVIVPFQYVSFLRKNSRGKNSSDVNGRSSKTSRSSWDLLIPPTPTTLTSYRGVCKGPLEDLDLAIKLPLLSCAWLFLAATRGLSGWNWVGDSAAFLQTNQNIPRQLWNKAQELACKTTLTLEPTSYWCGFIRGEE